MNKEYTLKFIGKILDSKINKKNLAIEENTIIKMLRNSPKWFHYRATKQGQILLLDLSSEGIQEYINKYPKSENISEIEKIKDNKPFDFSEEYQESNSMEKFSNGTPHILSLSTLKSSLDITISASTKKLENKSHKLFHFFESIYKEKLSDKKFNLITKNNRDESGSHISLHHNEAWRISQCLISPI